MAGPPPSVYYADYSQRPLISKRRATLVARFTTRLAYWNLLRNIANQTAYELVRAARRSFADAFGRPRKRLFAPELLPLARLYAPRNLPRYALAPKHPIGAYTFQISQETPFTQRAALEIELASRPGRGRRRYRLRKPGDPANTAADRAIAWCLAQDAKIPQRTLARPNASPDDALIPTTNNATHDWHHPEPVTAPLDPDDPLPPQQRIALRLVANYAAQLVWDQKLLRWRGAAPNGTGLLRLVAAPPAVTPPGWPGPPPTIRPEDLAALEAAGLPAPPTADDELEAVEGLRIGHRMIPVVARALATSGVGGVRLAPLRGRYASEVRGRLARDGALAEWPVAESGPWSPAPGEAVPTVVVRLAKGDFVFLLSPKSCHTRPGSLSPR